MKIVALMGKAGSGKDTILRAIMNRYPNVFNEIVSCTTRPPREGEVDGVNYYFLSVKEFSDKVINGDMLEATVFNTWHYGTMKSGLSEDKINIGVFNPDGVYALQGNPDIDLKVYLIDASDKTRLLRQLNREQNPDVHEIIRRYKADELDFIDLSDIKYRTMVNEKPDDKLLIPGYIWADQFN